MAGIRSGLFNGKFTCQECEKNPKMKDVWGCESPAQMGNTLVDEYKDKDFRYVYKNCPFKFIPSSVQGFFILYDYYKSFPNATMPAIGDVSFRFLFAYKFYEARLSRYAREVNNGNG